MGCLLDVSNFYVRFCENSVIALILQQPQYSHEIGVIVLQDKKTRWCSAFWKTTCRLKGSGYKLTICRRLPAWVARQPGHKASWKSALAL